MTRTLTIALVHTTFPRESTGGRTFEEEILYAALTVPTRHKLLIYPRTSRVEKLVAELGIAHRVSFVPLVRNPRFPRRVWRRAKRTLLRRARPLPFAELSAALRKAGADCAWMLGGTLVPLDLPYVATIWDLQHRVQPWFPEVSNGGEGRARERLYAEFVRRASVVLTGTNAGAREIRDAYGDASGATQVVPLPAPNFALAAGLRPRGHRPTELPARYLLYPAQFWAHKNHITAVRALAAASSLPEPPELMLLGADRGTKQYVMDEAQALGVAHRVHALGFVDQQRLISLYQHADALIFPSLFGPDNLPPLEAMALGCPVIAARVAGAEEQIGDAGLLVDALNPDAFAHAIRTLRLDASLRDALIERGRVRARSWTPQQYVATVLSLIESRIAPVRELWP